ncbi:MAG: DUF4231 domain-containing protein [Colwellia sp.]|nr:DUF4231 domain-containing protein [Colwellia sp.]
MNSDQYIEERLDPQIEWYDQKSMRNQKNFKRLRTIEIGLAGSIPFLIGYVTDERPAMGFIVGVTGVAVAFVSGILALYQYQEHWIQYRTTCETLRHQKIRFQTKAPPYTGSDAFHILVENVEAIISKENTSWSKKSQTQQKENPHG